MSLAPGARLGPYAIVAPLGAGGPPSFALDIAVRELRRGLAKAEEPTPW